MNQEVLNKINQLEEELKELKASLTTKDEPKWREGGDYYKINCSPSSRNLLDIEAICFEKNFEGLNNPNSLNMFKTQEEAEQAREIIAGVLYQLSVGTTSDHYGFDRRWGKAVFEQIKDKKVIKRD